MPVPNHVQELVARQQAGERVRYVFFWGHKSRADGRVGKDCLSQWAPTPFTVDDVPYPTAEHWMMAGKARLFRDDEALTKILSARSPSAAKRAGREVRNFEESVWQQERFAIVVEGNRHKFQQHPALREFLLATKNRILVEASPRDRIWGIGLSQDDPRAEDPAMWRGLNLLGFALMKAREQLLELRQSE